MKLKLITLSVSMVAFSVAILSLPLDSVLAYKGDPNLQGPNYSLERHNEMLEALAKNDYNAWRSLVGDRGISRKINKENFAKFAQTHKLALSGKTEEAKALRIELGLGQKQGHGTRINQNERCPLISR